VAAVETAWNDIQASLSSEIAAIEQGVLLSSDASSPLLSSSRFTL
jgi:hypothetical protein